MILSKTFILILLLAIASVEAKYKYKPPGKLHKGWGTAYSGAFQINKTGKNACQFDVRKLDRKWNIYYAAMNEADWKAIGGNRGGRSNACGRCIEVKGKKGQTTRGHEIKPIIAKVVDLCPSWACNKGSVDFSTVALEAITGYSWDKKKISWRYVDCPIPGQKPRPPKPSSPKPSPPKPSPPPTPAEPTEGLTAAEQELGLTAAEQEVLDQLEY